MGRHEAPEQPPTPEESQIPEQQIPAGPSPTHEWPPINRQEPVTEPLPVQRYAPALEQAHSQQGRDADPGRRKLVIGLASAITLVAAAGVTGLGYKEGWWLSNKNRSPESQPGQPKISAERPIQGLPPEFDHAKKETLITDTWHMLGATRKKDGSMGINAAGHAIRKVDDDGYIPNPPIMRSGPRVSTKRNDFGVTARLSNVETDKATLYLNARPNIILDEADFRQPAIGITRQKSKDSKEELAIGIWHGKEDVADETHVIPATSADGVTDVWVQQVDGHVIVGSGDHKQVIKTSMFADSGQVVFGADGNFTLDTLDVYSTGKEPVAIRDTSTEVLPPLDPNGFQALARANGRPDLIIGTALDLGPLDEVKSVLNQVGGIKTEMLAKMQAVFKGAPAENGDITDADFEWQEVDAFVELAQRSKRNVDIHTLIFGEAMPAGVEAFLRKCAETKNKAAAANFMKQYITTFVGRYKDAVDTWDVVNEPLADTGDDNTATLRKHLWYDAFGGTEKGGIEYITLACQTARDAGAKRIRINENGCETDVPRRNKLRSIARPLKKAGILDAIGLQSHLDFSWEENDEGELEESGDIADYVNDDRNVDATYVRDEYESYFKIFAADGLDVDVTELSINIDESDRKHQQSRETIQAIVHAGIFDAAMKHKNVRSIYWWGMVNGDYYMTSGKENGKIVRGYDAPYSADKHGKPVARPNIVGAIKAGIRGEV